MERALSVRGPLVALWGFGWRGLFVEKQTSTCGIMDEGIYLAGPFLQQFPFIERHTSKKRNSSTRKKIRNTQGCQIASFWVNVCFSAKQHELGGRPSRSSGPFMDKPRPGQESEPPVRRPPMEIVGEQNRRTIGDQRLLLAKTRMCKTSTLSEIWLVPIFCFFLLVDQTASHFFPFPIFNHDELKRSLTHPSLALTNMQHSR